MSYYRYSPDSLIDQIHFYANVAGGTRAYLHARPDVTAEQLAPIHDQLAKLDWKSAPHNDSGKPTFEIRGFKSKQELIDMLAANNWIKGAPAIEASSTDHMSFGQKLRNLTLRGTGLIYNIGDVAYMTYAVQNDKHARAERHKAQTITPDGIIKENAEIAAKNEATLARNAAIDQKGFWAKLFSVKGHTNKAVTKEIMLKNGAELVKSARINYLAGAGYALGGITLSFFGSKDQSPYEIKETSQKVKTFLQAKGVEISPQSSLHNTTQKDQSGLLNRTAHFIRRYPSEILNFIYTGVGVALSLQSYKAYRVTKDPTDKTDIGLGVVTTISSLAGIFIKEKKRPEGAPKRTGLAGVWDWIQEKPLRATGYGFMVATAFHAHASYGKYQTGDAVARKTVIGRCVFVLANVAAEILMAVSSKGHGHGVKTDNSVSTAVLANAAETIAQQAPEKQEGLVKELAVYLSEPKVMGGKIEEIEATLRKQIAGMDKNPWARGVKTAPAIAAPVEAPSEIPTHQVTSATLEYAAKHETKVEDKASWQARAEHEKEAQSAHSAAIA